MMRVLGNVMHEKYFQIIDGSLTFEPHPVAC